MNIKALLKHFCALICAVIALFKITVPAVYAMPDNSLVIVAGEEIAAFGFQLFTSDSGNQYILTTAMGSEGSRMKVVSLVSGTEVTGTVVEQMPDYDVMVVCLDSELGGMRDVNAAPMSNLSKGQTIETVGVDADDDIGTVEGRIDYIQNGVLADFTLDSQLQCTGAPLCLSDGTVIGIIISSQGDSGTAVSIDTLFNDDSDSSGSSGGGSGGGSSGSSGGGSGGGSGGDSGYFIPLLAIAGGGAGYYIYKRRKGQSNSQQSPPSYAPAQHESIGATQPVMVTQPVTPSKLVGIRGTGGQYSTMSFPIHDRSLIGRDPAKCGIVFSPQTPGVSSLHCEIIRVGENLQLTDRGSTHGTFLNGTKLQINVPAHLKSGDSFYLGERRNGFVVY